MAFICTNKPPTSHLASIFAQKHTLYRNMIIPVQIANMEEKLAKLDHNLRTLEGKVSKRASGNQSV